MNEGNRAANANTTQECSGFTKTKRVSSTIAYLRAVERIRKGWTPEALMSLNEFPKRDDYHVMAKIAWFRGHAQESWALKPNLFRRDDYSKGAEIALNLKCRNMARRFVEAPQETDFSAWLGFMQHHGLPTRMLDWTESSLNGLYFAVEQWETYKKNWRRWPWFDPIVWIMNPHAFNWVSLKSSQVPRSSLTEQVGNSRDGYSPAYGCYNIFPAFGVHVDGYEEPGPMAIEPPYVHPRMQVQLSRFTVHVNHKESIQSQFANTEIATANFIVGIRINKAYAQQILRELRDMGISRSTLFPDIEGLTHDMSTYLSMLDIDKTAEESSPGQQ